MAVELIVTVEAEQDAQEAYDWYEKRRYGLGEEFLGCLEAGILLILRNPASFAKVFEDYRRAPMRRFPYSIIYELVDDKVTIHSVFHASRDPAKWRERLP